MTDRLRDKVALVTGGGSGIGRATALLFAREGAAVVVADIAPAGGEDTVAAIRAAGGQARFVRADVTRADEVAALVEAAVASYGRLDCAFNNAGIGGDEGLTHEYPEEEFRRVIDVNLVSVWLCMKAELGQMLRQGGGAIVNTASVLGLVGFQNGPAYVAAKHGVVGLTRAAALEYAAHKIRVNAICPGWTLTPMTAEEAASPELSAQVIARHPLGRFGTPEEMAEAAAWLCSDAASFVTGVALASDGGYTAQ